MITCRYEPCWDGLTWGSCLWDDVMEVVVRRISRIATFVCLIGMREGCERAACLWVYIETGLKSEFFCALNPEWESEWSRRVCAEGHYSSAKKYFFDIHINSKTISSLCSMINPFIICTFVARECTFIYMSKQKIDSQKSRTSTGKKIRGKLHQWE